MVPNNDQGINDRATDLARLVLQGPDFESFYNASALYRVHGLRNGKRLQLSSLRLNFGIIARWHARAASGILGQDGERWKWFLGNCGLRG